MLMAAANHSTESEEKGEVTAFENRMFHSNGLCPVIYSSRRHCTNATSRHGRLERRLWRSRLYHPSSIYLEETVQRICIDQAAIYSFHAEWSIDARDGQFPALPMWVARRWEGMADHTSVGYAYAYGRYG
jgi:hypothetical protein